jgi:hypothetical protein
MYFLFLTNAFGLTGYFVGPNLFCYNKTNAEVPFCFSKKIVDVERIGTCRHATIVQISRSNKTSFASMKYLQDWGLVGDVSGCGRSGEIIPRRRPAQPYDICPS